MGCELIEVVLEPPKPMSREEFWHWEGLNRPEGCEYLEELEPVGGEEPASKWRCVYLECDPETAAMMR
jgi:hypothetical protein